MNILIAAGSRGALSQLRPEFESFIAMAERGHRLTIVIKPDSVYVPRLRTEVTVFEMPSKGRVRVASGPVKLWVTVAELHRVGLPAEAPKPSPPPAPETPAEVRVRPPDPDNTLDVRGMRVDDALSMAESFLDRLFGRSEVVGYILHGIGSGALRDAIREHLDAHAGHYVARTRGGTSDEGGDRLTVVYLK